MGIRIHGKQRQANVLAGYNSSLVDAILKKVTPHVPVSAPAVKPSQQVQQALVNLNLAAAKLLSRFLPTQASAEGEEEEEWRGRLLDYYTKIMEAGQVLPSRSVRLKAHKPAASSFSPLSLSFFPSCCLSFPHMFLHPPLPVFRHL